MQVSVVIYRGEDYETYVDAYDDGAVYDYITLTHLEELTVKDFAVDKAMSVADMLGYPSIVAVILDTEGLVLGELEFGQINSESLEKITKHRKFNTMPKTQIKTIVGWNYENGTGVKYDMEFPIGMSEEKMYNEASDFFRKIAEERCGNGDNLWVVAVTDVTRIYTTYECNSEYDEFGFDKPSKKIFKYSISTNTIWFGGDNGQVEAESYEEARELAQKEVEEHLRKINSRIGDIDTIEIDLGAIEIEEA
jgi:hypothetical protein